LSVQNYPILFYKKNGSLQEHISKISVTDEEAIQGSINTHKKLEQDNENCKEELNYLKRSLKRRKKQFPSWNKVLHLIMNTFMEQSSTSYCEASAGLIQELEVMLEKISLTLRTQEKNHEEEKQRLTQVITTLNEVFNCSIFVLFCSAI
jgi:hypothetical protein